MHRFGDNTRHVCANQISPDLRAPTEETVFIIVHLFWDFVERAHDIGDAAVCDRHSDENTRLSEPLEIRFWYPFPNGLAHRLIIDDAAEPDATGITVALPVISMPGIQKLSQLRADEDTVQCFCGILASQRVL